MVARAFLFGVLADCLEFTERCVEHIGGPENLIGDCQGGWLAAIRQVASLGGDLYDRPSSKGTHAACLPLGRTGQPNVALRRRA